jgi:hypothetical protein
LPDNRVLQRLFTATGLANVLATVHETHLETQQSKNLSLLASLQNKIEWLEVAIVAVYMVEIMHILHGVFQHAQDGGAEHHGFPWGPVVQGGLILVLAFVAGAMALVFLQPFRHDVDLDTAKRRARWFFPVMMLLPILYFVFQTVWFLCAH